MSLTQELRAAGQKAAKDCCKFLNSSPTPFHAVQSCKEQLLAEGFEHLKENEGWSGRVKDNGKYFVTRNQSSIIAFVVGGKFSYTGGTGGFKIVGAHTDSPCFQLKPKSAEKGHGYKQVGIQTYGGGLWHTWFDRDISLAGRVVFKNPDGVLQSTLVDLKKPIMRIPNLAIHLRPRGEDGFKFNKEGHLKPMLCSELMSGLFNEKEKKDGVKDEKEKAAEVKHHPELLEAVAKEVGVSAQELVDFELYVYDTQDAVIGGLYDEFIFSARIDNLISCYSGLDAITSFSRSGVADDMMVSMVTFYDHEEVGSDSHVGAGSKFTNDVMRRIVMCFSPANDPAAVEQAVTNSFVMSVDGVHGVHPNYSEHHQALHRPLFHKGPAIKFNANQRYATTSVGAAVIRRCAELSDVPLQDICVANDSPCGSTIGPIISTGTGIHTLDIGVPMLSMHSVREQCGTVDLYYMNKLLFSFFKSYNPVRAALPVE